MVTREETRETAWAKALWIRRVGLSGSQTGQNLPKVTPSPRQGWVGAQSLVTPMSHHLLDAQSQRAAQVCVGGSGEQVPVETIKPRLSPSPRPRFKLNEKLKDWPLRKMSSRLENLSV